MSGHKCVRAQTCVGTNVSGHKRVWAQSCLGTIVSGHKRVWAQSCLGIIVCGHNRVWAQSCLGTIVCGHNRVGSIMYGPNRGGTDNESSSASGSVCASASEEEEGVPCSGSDDSVADKNYVPNSEELSSELEDQQSRNTEMESQNSANLTPTKKRKKRRKRPQMWKRNITKRVRNEGKEYVTRGKSKTIREARAVKQPCGKKCRLRCSEIISEEQRQVIFDSYWALKTIEKQRMYIANVTKTVEPKYRL